MSRVLINVIIVNYNTPELCARCVRSIKRLNSEVQIRFFIVDNGSSEVNYRSLIDLISMDFNMFTCTATDIATENGAEVVVLENTNLGFAGGNNVVLRHLLEKGDDDPVLLINPDTEVISGNLLLDLVRNFNQNEVWGCATYKASSPETLLCDGLMSYHPYFGRVASGKSDLNPSTSFVHGGFMFTRMSVFRKVGLLNESYFLYWEEVEWCFRCLQQGIVLKAIVNHIIYDEVSASIGRGYLANYYYSKNALRFLRENYGGLNVFTATLFHFGRAMKFLISGKTDIFTGAFQGLLSFYKEK
ncbi:MAG: GT2 family glycosyltransferase [Parvicella sp.]|jgi:GT2 family glycosyltransferase